VTGSGEFELQSRTTFAGVKMSVNYVTY